MIVSRALARVGIRRTAQSARRENVPVARRRTCRLHVAGRAGCTPQDVPVARLKTCRVRAARRAGSTRKTRRLRVQDAPVACRVRARKTCRIRAVCARGPVRPFAWRRASPRSCCSPAEAGGVADGAASPGRLGRGASLCPLAAFREKHPALELKPGRKKLRRSVLRTQAVCLWRCLLASPSATRRKRMEKQNTPGAGERKAAEPSEERDA